MTLTLATLAALFLPAMVIIAASVLIGWQLNRLQRRCERCRDWTAAMSVERYRPMFRLLDDSDIRFLRAQPGATPAMIDRLRKQRCHVFRGYLSSLEHDFQEACDALLMVMIQSQHDRRELIPALIVSRLKFSAGIMQIRCRLLLYRWNIRQESVARVVNLFEGLQLELLLLTPIADGVQG